MRYFCVCAIVLAVFSSVGCGKSLEEQGRSSEVPPSPSAQHEDSGNNIVPKSSDAADKKIANESGATQSDEAKEAGIAAYAKGMCSKCHGDDGMGGARGPDLTDNVWQHCDGSVSGIRDVLVSGVPKDKVLDPKRPFGMNPATNLIKDAQALDALAQFVHDLHTN